MVKTMTSHHWVINTMIRNCQAQSIPRLFKNSLFSSPLLLKIFCLFPLACFHQWRILPLTLGPSMWLALANQQTRGVHLLESTWHSRYNQAGSPAPLPYPGEEPPGIPAASSSAWSPEWIFAGRSRARKKQGAQLSQIDVWEQHSQSCPSHYNLQINWWISIFWLRFLWRYEA